jgi:YD repeat-containing protein
LKEVIAVTTRNPGKNLRFKWDKDGGRVEVRFADKGPNKAQITIDHTGLANAASVKRVKALWAEAMAKLESLTTKK